MDPQTPVLAIVSQESERELAHNVAAALGYPHANVVVGTPATAAGLLQQQRYTPRYILISIGARGNDILPEIDQLALYCDSDTRVVVIGQTNDIGFYRALIDRGVSEYFAHGASIEELRAVLFSVSEQAAGKGHVVSFMGSGASDGCSTLAVNAAYALAFDCKKKTVLVDFDYQFGMVAKQLDLRPQYGIKELFEHPERGIDDTLIARMTVPYKSSLDVIAAPLALQFLPMIQPELVRDLIAALQRKYDVVILDLPHLWTNWLSTTLSCSQGIVLVSQLWLKSVTHAARMLTAWQRLGLDEKQFISVINRSGSKFKEGISAKDFERVCNRRIDLYVPNDIKTVARAENEGLTLMELGDSLVSREVRKLAERIAQKVESGKPAQTSSKRLTR